MLRILLLSVVLVPVASLAADTDSKTFTDPQKAGPDYAVQGEYLGHIADDETKVLGAQVIALGGGKFDLVGYHNGLPGQGWSRGDSSVRGTGETKDGVVTITIENTVAVIKNGKMTVTTNDGRPFAELKKTLRKSPTLGDKPPEGAKTLFDGTTAEQFENGKIVQNDLLLADCSSRTKLGDHSLHLEFRTPFVPAARGQARGNSGMYLQSRYEVQVLDSFGLEGKNNECGGIYSIAEPIVNMCFPPLTWQTYDYDFTAARYDDSGKKTANARVTIRHNGVLIHDNLELPHGTPGRLEEGPGPESLYLQGHGNPVVYRNIWAVEK